VSVQKTNYNIVNSSIAEDEIIKEKPFSLLRGLHKIESGKVYEAVS